MTYYDLGSDFVEALEKGEYPKDVLQELLKKLEEID